jgi:hypothetical protein
MKDASANWPGTEEHDAERERKTLREQGKRGGDASGDNRQENPSPSPIIEFITKELKRTRDISGREMEDALKAEAENALDDGRIIMSADGKALLLWTTKKRDIASRYQASRRRFQDSEKKFEKVFNANRFKLKTRCRPMPSFNKRVAFGVQGHPSTKRWPSCPFHRRDCQSTPERSPIASMR